MDTVKASKHAFTHWLNDSECVSVNVCLLTDRSRLLVH